MSSDIRSTTTPAQRRFLRALGLLATALLLASGLTGCTTTPPLATTMTTQVGARGFAAEVIGARVSGGAGVAREGTSVTVAAVEQPFPGGLAKDFTGIGGTVRVRLGKDQQPDSAITLKLEVEPNSVSKADWSTPRTFAVLTQSAGSRTPTLLPATYDARTHTLTAVTTHLSWFRAVQFDAGRVITEAVKGVAAAFKLRFAEPGCVKEEKSATHAGYTYTLDSSWAAGACLSADSDALLVDVSSLSGLPFSADTAKTGTVQALPGLSTSGVLSTAVYDTLFGFNGSHLLAPGGMLRFRFTGYPPARITFTQAPAMLLVAILIETLQTVFAAMDPQAGVLQKLDESTGKLDDLDCMSSVVDSALAAKDKLDATTSGSLVAAAITCIGTTVKPGPGAIIWALLTAAPTLFATAIFGLVTTLIGKGSFSLTFTAKAAPVLAASWAPYQEGFGTVRPGTVFNGGDPTGMVEDIVWNSWGGATAVGHGTSCYLGPGDFTYQCRSAPATIVASNLGTCDGKAAYEDVGWFFPGPDSETQQSAEGDDVRNCEYGTSPTSTPTPAHSGGPVLGDAAEASSDGSAAHGFGEMRPALLATSSSTEPYEDIVWASWGGATATGAGRICSPNGATCRSKTFQATELGTCAGVTAYMTLTVFDADGSRDAVLIAGCKAVRGAGSQ